MAPMEMELARQQPTAGAPAAQALGTSRPAGVQRPRLQATRLRQLMAYARRADRRHRAVTSLVLSHQPLLSHQPRAARDPATAVSACVATQLTMHLPRASNPIGLAVQIGRAVHISPTVRIERTRQVDQPFPIAP
jgi:hypothetical protein